MYKNVCSTVVNIQIVFGWMTYIVSSGALNSTHSLGWIGLHLQIDGIYLFRSTKFTHVHVWNTTTL